MTIMEALEWADRIPEEEWNKVVNPKHGKVVKVKQLAFHDVIYYEDGYVEAIYIGD